MTDFNVTAIHGTFRVEKEGRTRRRPPRRHMTFSAAETAASALIDANPGETFVIVQEVARVARHVRAVRA